MPKASSFTDFIADKATCQHRNVHANGMCAECSNPVTPEAMDKLRDSIIASEPTPESRDQWLSIFGLEPHDPNAKARIDDEYERWKEDLEYSIEYPD